MSQWEPKESPDTPVVAGKMADITIKQVAHMLRNASEDMVNPRYRKKFKEGADAIDHHIAASQCAEVVAVAGEAYTLDNKPLVHALFEQAKSDFYASLGATETSEEWRERPKIEWSRNGVFERYVVSQIDFEYFREGFQAAMADKDQRIGEAENCIETMGKEIAELKELLGEVGEAQTAAIRSREELQAECDRMEALVKDAYEEGVRDGYADFVSWETSNARTALTEMTYRIHLKRIRRLR